MESVGAMDMYSFLSKAMGFLEYDVELMCLLYIQGNGSHITWHTFKMHIEDLSLPKVARECFMVLHKNPHPHKNHIYLSSIYVSNYRGNGYASYLMCIV